MIRHINYNDLSADIRKEMEGIFAEEKSRNPALTMEDVMLLWFEERFDRWMLDHYGNKSDRDKRLFFRFDIEIPVKVVERLIDSESNEAEEMDYVGTVVNISRGGFYFKSKDPVHVSSIIKVIIDLSAIDTNLSEVEALAMVVRLDELDKKNYGIGVMFSSIYCDHRENLDLFIFRNVAYHIYNR